METSRWGSVLTTAGKRRITTSSVSIVITVVRFLIIGILPRKSRFAETPLQSPELAYKTCCYNLKASKIRNSVDAMSPATNDIFEFGPYRMDSHRRVLERGGEV